MKYNQNLLFFFLLISLGNLTAQSEEAKPDFSKNVDSQNGTFSIGLNGRNYRIINGFTNPPQKLYFPVAGLSLTYNPIKRMSVGLNYSHQWIWGTFVPKVQNYSFASAFLRYDFLRKKNAFYVESSYVLSNIAWSNTGWQSHSQTNFAGIGLGVRAKMYPNVYFNYSINYLFNLNNSNFSNLFDKRVGIIYAIKPKVKDTPLFIADKKKDKTGKWVLGVGASFMPFDSADFAGSYNIIESTLRLGYYQSNFLSFGLYNRFFIGDSKIPNYPTQYFYFTGPYVNFKLSINRWSYFFEAAYVTSNFTLLNGGATNELPAKGSAQYFSPTTGFAYKINNDLSFEIGINASTAIKSNTGSLYGAGGYRLAIEKTFRIKKRERIKVLN